MPLPRPSTRRHSLLARVSSQRASRVRDRSIGEHLVLAIPQPILRLAFAAGRRLPPGSSLRRRLLKRVVMRSLTKSGGGEFEFALSFYEPDVELHVLGSLARALGLAESYHGHAGYRELWSDYQRDMEGLRVEPEEMIDLGDRVAVRATLVGTGRMSGATTRNTEGFVFYLSPSGLIARQEIYWSWEDTLSALGASS